MKADILKLLLQSHADGDESSFRRAALQLASAESASGHVHVADEIRAIIAKMPPTSARKVDPAGLLEGLRKGGRGGQPTCEQLAALKQLDPEAA